MKVIKFRENITIHQFARDAGIKEEDIIKVQAEYAIEDVLTLEATCLLCQIYEIVLLNEKDEFVYLGPLPDKKIPIVTFVGHIDHGKTSLIDCVLETSYAIKETGGITQNVHFHEITFQNKPFILMDTPGHAVFEDLRDLMIKLSDLIVVVIAADCGVQEQTIEILKKIKHKQKIICITKIDCKKSGHDKIWHDLANLEVLCDVYGGDVLTNFVSSRKKQGMEELLQNILLQTELMELRTNTQADGLGYVSDAVQRRGVGLLVRVVLLAGSIQVGQYFFSQGQYERIKDIFYQGKRVTSATVGQVIDIVGFSVAPELGNLFIGFGGVTGTNKTAEYLLRIYPDALKINMRAEQSTDRKFIVRVEKIAYLSTILPLLQERGMVLTSGLGIIQEKDIEYADAAKAILIYWGIGNPLAKKSSNITTPIIWSEVIYEILESIDAKKEKVKLEEETGVAFIKKIFEITDNRKKIIIAGCGVLSGTIKIGNLFYLKRGDEKILKGKIVSLKREKHDIEEAKKGTECGILIDTLEVYSQDTNFAIKDQIVAFEEK